MKRLAFLLQFVIFASVARAQVPATDLMGLGMPGALASKVASIGQGSASLANNSFLSTDSASGTPVANLLLKSDASDNTHLNAPTGKVINLDVAVTPSVKLDATKLQFQQSQGVLSAPTAIALSAGAADTPNYTFDAAKLLGPSTMVLSAPTALGIAAGAASTPNANFKVDGLQFVTSGNQPYFPLPAVITPSTSYPTPNAGDTLSARYSLIAASNPTATFVELPRSTPNAGKTFSLYHQGTNPVAIVPQSGDSLNATAAGTPFSCTTGKWCDCTTITSGIYACRQN